MNYLMDQRMQYKDSKELNQALIQKYEDKRLKRLLNEHLHLALKIKNGKLSV